MTASQDMKQLRILTGTHAGAVLDLVPGQYLIGNGEDSDIFVSDWEFPTLQLGIDAAGSAHAQWGPGPGLNLADFAVCSFGTPSICLGPVDGAWPAHAELMAQARAIPRDPVLAGRIGRRSGRRASWVWKACAGLVGLGLVGSLIAATARPDAPIVLSAEQRRATLQQRLDAMAPGALQASLTGRTLQIDGVVRDAQQVRQVEAVLAEYQTQFVLQRRYLAASDLIETLRAAIDISDVRIDYLGRGEFRVESQAPDSAALRTSIQALADELKPAVRKIELSFAPAAPAPGKTIDDADIRAHWNADDQVHVLETRAGVKYLVLGKVEESDPVDSKVWGR